MILFNFGIMDNLYAIHQGSWQKMYMTTEHEKQGIFSPDFTSNIYDAYFFFSLSLSTRIT